MADTPTDSQVTTGFDQLPALNTTLPANPTFTTTGNDFNPAHSSLLGTDPYAGNAQLDPYSQAYATSLGRYAKPGEIEKYWASTPLEQAKQGIAGSEEASNYQQTYGRAANEINPTVDSQIQALASQSALAGTAAQSQLSALDPKYADQYNSLLLGYNQNLAGGNQRLSQLQQDYNINANRAQSALSLIPNQAFEMANRRGLLDSSLAYTNILSPMALPKEQAFEDLTRQYAQNRSTAQANLQNIISKYQADRGTLVSQRAQEAQAIRDQLSQQQQQYGIQAALQEAQRNPQIAARAGSLGDLMREFQLQQQQVGGYLQNLQATQGQQGPLNQAMQNYYNQLAAHAK